MELEDEKRAVQQEHDYLFADIENLFASSGGQTQKWQDVHSHKLKALQAQVQLQLKIKQEAEQFLQWRKNFCSLSGREQLCNLICPSKPESVYLLVLNKAHTQEEFIRGSITKNPYSSAEVGPLMRDVKNKICHQLDLLGLVEGDYGMELVAGDIISLDLIVAQVYEQVWKKATIQSSSTSSNVIMLLYGATAATRDCSPMVVTYCLQRLRDGLKSNHEWLIVVLNLLMHCCKIKEKRRALLSLGALCLLFETARRAFSVDAMEAAEAILLIVEALTLEANESDNISITQSGLTVTSEETGAGEQAKKIVLMFLDRLSHTSGMKKSSKQQRNTEMVSRILSYLTYGEPAAMGSSCGTF